MWRLEIFLPFDLYRIPELLRRGVILHWIISTVQRFGYRLENGKAMDSTLAEKAFAMLIRRQSLVGDFDSVLLRSLRYRSVLDWEQSIQKNAISSVPRDGCFDTSPPAISIKLNFRINRVKAQGEGHKEQTVRLMDISARNALPS